MPRWTRMTTRRREGGGGRGRAADLGCREGREREWRRRQRSHPLSPLARPSRHGRQSSHQMSGGAVEAQRAAPRAAPPPATPLSLRSQHVGKLVARRGCPIDRTTAAAGSPARAPHAGTEGRVQKHGASKPRDKTRGEVAGSGVSVTPCAHRRGPEPGPPLPPRPPAPAHSHPPSPRARPPPRSHGPAQVVPDRRPGGAPPRAPGRHARAALAGRGREVGERERGRGGPDRGWAAEPRPPLLTPPPTLPPSPRLGLHVRAPTPKQRPAVGRPPRLVFPEDRAARSMLARRPEVQKRGGGGDLSGAAEAGRRANAVRGRLANPSSSSLLDPVHPGRPGVQRTCLFKTGRPGRGSRHRGRRPPPRDAARGGRRGGGRRAGVPGRTAGSGAARGGGRAAGGTGAGARGGRRRRKLRERESEGAG